MFHFEFSAHYFRKLLVWALLFPTLTDIRAYAACPKPGREGNAIVSGLLQEEYEEGSKVTYECISGYVRSGGSREVTCTNGEWSRLQLKCEKKSCGPPGDILNGEWNFSEGIEFGATVTLTCNTGYKLAGKASTMQCEVDGWKGGVIACEVVKCDLPPDIQNGTSVMDGEKGYLTYQETVTYTCNENYALIGETTILCSEDGTYRPQPPTCQEVVCPPPKVDFATRIEGRPPYAYKSFIVFKCNDGHDIIGSERMICEVDGWTKAPVCQKRAPASSSTSPPKTTASTTPGTSRKAMTTTPVRGGAACTGSLRSQVFSALVQRVVIALLIPVSLHLSR